MTPTQRRVLGCVGTFFLVLVLMTLFALLIGGLIYLVLQI